ncbi:MAG: phosphate ABC transporter permease PstA [Methanotrichaceae archaeon]|nr:phosphate ABC transporter permease PstA [Methanotrichaceae archaeon]
MRIEDAACKAAIALGLVLFATSIAALLLSPNLSPLSMAWEAILPLSAASIALAAAKAERRSAWTAMDLVFMLALACVIATGSINPDTVLTIEELGGSLGYQSALPLLVLLASMISVKDGINHLYHNSNKGREVLAFFTIRLSAVITILILLGIFFTILYNGIWAISWEFLTASHYRLGQSGGISTCIQGTFCLVIGAMILSVPLGTGAAIYMIEYSRNVRLKKAVSIAVGSLNGVPSVVYGLFGLAFLVSTVGISLLAGSIILGLMNLPTIILTSQEALKSVPNSLREGSVALGASKWQTIRKVVLPSAMPGILTGMIIGVARAAGETAPIMWTAVTFTATPVTGLFHPVNNLCYHLLQLIYFLGAWDVESNAWGTALVLLLLVLVINMIAIVIRNHYRKRISW